MDWRERECRRQESGRPLCTVLLKQFFHFKISFGVRNSPPPTLNLRYPLASFLQEEQYVSSSLVVFCIQSCFEQWVILQLDIAAAVLPSEP